MKQVLLTALLLLCAVPAAGQQALGLPTEGERHAMDVMSYGTVAMNVAMAVADCHHDGQWDKKCLTRLGVKNAAAFGIGQLTKKVFHTTRPCEPNLCGIDHGTGSTLSNHTLFSFVNVDPWGQTHLGFAVEYSIALGTGAGRVTSLRHELVRDVLPSLLAAQGINALTHRFIR